MVIDQLITDKFALWNGDSCEILPSFPKDSIGQILESPPFGSSIYNHSSSPHDLSNCKSYAEFFEHYRFIVEQHQRVLKPGRMACIHCADIPQDGHLIDLPGHICRLYEDNGFVFHDKKIIWKEPLRVAIRTRSLKLRHSQIVKDSSLCGSANGDYILVMRKKGANAEPIAHPEGLTTYYGETDPDKRTEMSLAPIPEGLIQHFKHWRDPKTNKWAHWIWQHYASCVWSDIRIGNVLPYKNARETPEEKHPHPTQLDALMRCIQLWSNPGDRVLTSFMGVGSEVYSAVRMDRIGIGIELKTSYYRQSVENMKLAEASSDLDQVLFDWDSDDVVDDDETEESAA